MLCMKTTLKLKNKSVVGISLTFYLSIETISRPPQSHETIPLIVSLHCFVIIAVNMETGLL
jgi:hypothetical protein